MKAHQQAIDWALAKNYRCSVWDGEEWALCLSPDRKAIIDAIESVEFATVNIRELGQADIIVSLDLIPYGVGDTETISDYYPADGEFNDWFDQRNAEDWK